MHIYMHVCVLHDVVCRLYERVKCVCVCLWCDLKVFNTRIHTCIYIHILYTYVYIYQEMHKAQKALLMRRHSRLVEQHRQTDKKDNSNNNNSKQTDQVTRSVSVSGTSAFPFASSPATVVPTCEPLSP